MAEEFSPSVNIVTCYASHGLNFYIKCKLLSSSHLAVLEWLTCVSALVRNSIVFKNIIKISSKQTFINFCVFIIYNN